MSSLHQSHKQRNRFHTVALMSGMLLLLLLLCLSLFGSDGLLLVLLAFGLLALFTPRASAWLTLRLHRARQLSFDAAPNLYRIVEQLSRRAGLAQHPLLFYVPSATPNAFAMLEGDQALIAVTDGLLNRLNQAELTAVLAHEISHIRNGDLSVMMVADLLNRLTSSLSSVGWLMLVLFLPVWLLTDVMLPWLAIVLLMLAPLASTLLQLALSRTREFDADLDAAELTGDPATLAAALMKIEQSHDKWWLLLLPSRHQENPAWTRTHPSTAERVRRLRALAAEQYRHHEHSSTGFISPGSLWMVPVHRPGIW